MDSSSESDVDNIENYTLVRRQRKRNASPISNGSSEEDFTIKKQKHKFMATIEFTGQHPPNVSVVSKGLRGLQLSGGLDLIRLSSAKFKVVVTNERDLSLVIGTGTDVPSIWERSDYGTVVSSVFNYSKMFSPMLTFIIKNVDLDLSDEDIAEEITSQIPDAKTKRIISSTTNCPTSLIRVFTRNKEAKNNCISKGIPMFFKNHKCEESHQRPNQCSNCLSMGHSKRFCRKSLACVDLIRCKLCGGPHLATFNGCPAKVQTGRTAAVPKNSNTNFS